MQIEKVGLFGKFNDSSVNSAVVDVKNLLEKHRLNVLFDTSTAADIDGRRLDQHHPDLRQLIDLAIVVGGDGTMLGAARTLARHQVPAIGVNLGRLGFLTDIALQDFDHAIQAILTGRYREEKRTLLQATVYRNAEICYHGIALNDTVISKGNSGRLIEFETRVNGQFVSHTRSDGLIVSTPTGSTAYSLSAGGPIIYPTLPILSMTPICPHTLSNRPIVLDENAVIEISALSCPETPANLALDGLIVSRLCGDEVVALQKAKDKLCMLRIESHNHFEALHSKLGWNG